jgi:hypothetical protein
VTFGLGEAWYKAVDVFGTSMRRVLTSGALTAWCAEGRWGPRRVRTAECWATFDAEAAYDCLLRDAPLTMHAGALRRERAVVRDGRAFRDAVFDDQPFRCGPPEHPGGTGGIPPTRRIVAKRGPGTYRTDGRATASLKIKNLD